MNQRPDNEFVKNYFKWSFLVLVLFFLIGGTPITPRFFNKMRHAFYLEILIVIFFLTKEKYRSILKSFFNDPRNFLSEKSKNFYLKVLSVFYFFLYLKVSFLNYFSFNVHAVDFSIYDWIMPSLFHTGSFYSPACDCNHLGYHQTFILFLTAPLHFLINHPIFSVILHPVVAWLGYFPLKRILKEFKLSNIYQVLVVFIYFNYFGISHIVKNNLHIEVYYLPLILWLLFFIKTERFIGVIGSSLLLFIVKEDAPLYISSTLFASYVFIKRDFRYLLLSIASILFFYVNIKFIIPPFKGTEDYEFVNAVSKYGKDIAGTIKGIISSPIEVLKDVVTGGWVKYVMYFFFLPLTSGFFIIATFPIIFIHSIASSPLMRNMVLYYSAPLLPFLFYFLIDFLSKNRIVFLKFKLSLSARVKGYFLIGILLTSTLIGSGYLTFHSPRFNYSQFVANVEKIPNDKLICAMDSIFPHIGYEKRLLRMSDKCRVGKVDIFIIHGETWLNDLSQDQFDRIIDDVEKSGIYKKNVYKDGFIFYEKE